MAVGHSDQEKAGVFISNSRAVSIAAVLKRDCDFIMMTVEKGKHAEELTNIATALEYMPRVQETQMRIQQSRHQCFEGWKFVSQSDSVGCFFFFFSVHWRSPVIGDTPPIACSSLASFPAKLNTKARLKFVPTRHSSVPPAIASSLHACRFASHQTCTGAFCAISTNWPANNRCFSTSIAIMAQQPLPSSAQPTDIYGGGSFVTA